MEHVAELTGGKGVENSLNSRLQHLKHGLRPPLGEYESAAQFFNILSVKPIYMLNGAIFDLVEKELGTEARYSKSTRTTGHFVWSHLVEPLQEQSLELHENAGEVRSNFGERLKHFEEIGGRNLWVQSRIEVKL